MWSACWSYLATPESGEEFLSGLIMINCQIKLILEAAASMKVFHLFPNQRDFSAFIEMINSVQPVSGVFILYNAEGIDYNVVDGTPACQQMQN